MVQELDPHARGPPGVVAFFPQDINNKNIDWPFLPYLMEQTFSTSSAFPPLTRRSNRFMEMLAPLRAYFRPGDFKSSPLLCMTKEHWLPRLSVNLDSDRLGFGGARRIASEDLSV